MSAEQNATVKKLSLKKMVTPDHFNGPKRAKSSFMLFGDDRRDAITAEIKANLKDGEKFNVAMVAKAVGDAWKQTSEEVKETYKTKAAGLKAAHDAEMEKWKLSADYKNFVKAKALHSKKKADKQATVKAKESGMPMRPMVGYMLFANEVRETVRAEVVAQGMVFTVKTGAAGTKAKWDALGDEGKKVYNDKYLVAKAKYEEDLKAWNETDAGKEFAKSKATNLKRKQQDQKVGRRAKKQKKDAETAPEESVEESIEESGDGESSVELSGDEAAAEE